MTSLCFRRLALLAVVGTILFVFVPAPPASAVTIDFSVGPPLSGLITHFGGGPLVGTNISIDSVRGNGTPANDATFACDCVLNFTSGPLLASGPSFWVFQGGGDITITGTLSAPGGDIPVSMMGTFSAPQLTVDLFSPGMLDFGLSVALFVDSKNPELTSFFGLPQTQYNGFMGLFWAGVAGDEDGGNILATPLGGIVTNEPVPEPGTLLLLGGGLLGLAGARRRRGDA